jgi:hypothetical protein
MTPCAGTTITPDALIQGTIQQTTNMNVLNLLLHAAQTQPGQPTA